MPGTPLDAKTVWKEPHPQGHADHQVSRAAPWYVVPADDKENARLIVSQIVLDTLGTLQMSYPKSDAMRRQELLTIREQLLK
ncbi:hypothetical protein QN397_04325 [Variovorax sp. RTB1]|uniref:hypothetical protein n=1 Tax=Variovorax sp. RTB1 TaxID=3048631 RepID=UPI002B223F46|nr:hypothetical protein [Variovorax sp. RTB1]MEB0110581.1 hypothetical protein [Variovorax sp. RTB1]